MLNLAKNNLKTALLCGMLLGALSFLLLVMTQKNFRSSADVLVSQNQSGATDYYALSQSANYLTSMLSQSIYSEKFLEDVVATNKVPANFISGDSAARLKAWQHVIVVKNNPTVGIMTIQVFGDTQASTDQLASAVLDVLINQNSFFLGQDQNINVHVLSGPITEKNPSPTQIVLAIIGGFLVGGLLSILFIIYREEFSTQKIILKGNLSLERKTTETATVMPENLPAENFSSESFLSDEEYLSANSDYWKKKLEEKHS